jgi:heat-inducible transcriptional repressor
VGSEMLDKKYNIGVSPATIRNEMVYLSKQGYLSKDHSSSGRLPTAAALKLYVHELMKEKELTVADEVGVKEKIWNSRNNFDNLVMQVAKVLAERSRALGMVITDDHRVFHSGYANLLEMPEFFDIKVMRNVLTLIEEEKVLEEIFKFGTSENPIQVVYGGEFSNSDLEPVSMVFTTVENKEGEHKIRLAVLGSHRFDYPYILPMMKYFKRLIEELV